MYSLRKTWMDRITSEGIRATVHVRCFGCVAIVAKLRLFETNMFSSRTVNMWVEGHGGSKWQAGRLEQRQTGDLWIL